MRHFICTVPGRGLERMRASGAQAQSGSEVERAAWRLHLTCILRIKGSQQARRSMEASPGDGALGSESQWLGTMGVPNV